MQTIDLSTDRIRTGLETSQKFLERSILALYERQTAEEQTAGQTIDHNGVGFNGADAEFMTSLAEWIIAGARYRQPLGRRLRPAQADRARKVMKKYAGQLSKLAQERAEQSRTSWTGDKGSFSFQAQNIYLDPQYHELEVITHDGEWPQPEGAGGEYVLPADHPYVLWMERQEDAKEERRRAMDTGRAVPPVPVYDPEGAERAMHAMEAAGDRVQTLRDETNKHAARRRMEG